jgi:hypothetical protein
MSKKKTNAKKNLKKQKSTGAKKIALRAKLAASKKAAPKKKISLKKKAASNNTAASKIKAAPREMAATKKVMSRKEVVARKKTTTQAVVQRGSQSVETVNVKPRSRVARAGVGAGDYEGVSTIAHGDSESAEELLEEGQAFEAGVVSGVEDASDTDEAEVTTHEVPQDDVPGEYDGKDRP